MSIVWYRGSKPLNEQSVKCSGQFYITVQTIQQLSHCSTSSTRKWRPFVPRHARSWHMKNRSVDVHTAPTPSENREARSDTHRSCRCSSLASPSVISDTDSRVQTWKHYFLSCIFLSRFFSAHDRSSNRHETHRLVWARGHNLRVIYNRLHTQGGYALRRCPAVAMLLTD